MKANEARKLYFEDYIIFEHEIRRIYREVMETDKLFTKMSSIIEYLNSVNEKKELHLPLKLINKHISIRNILAHAESQYIFDRKTKDFMKNIKKFSKSIKKWKFNKNEKTKTIYLKQEKSNNYW